MITLSAKRLLLKKLRGLIDWARWNLPWHQAILSYADDRTLKALSRQLLSKKIKADQPVLFIPSYYQMKFSRMIDITLAFSLMLRGAKITPVLTGNFFSNEDVIFGGIYNSYRSKKKDWYSKLEKKIWMDLLKTKPVWLENYLTDDDVARARKIADSITHDNYLQIVVDGYDVGYKAAIATCNLNNRSELGNSTYLLEQLREHAGNIILLLSCYKRIYEQLKPKIIFSEFPHYYQWEVPYYLAQKKKIYLSSAVTTEKKNSWYFSSNTNSFQDATPAWHSFKNSATCHKEFEYVNKAIHERANRSVSHSPVFPKYHSKKLIEELKIFTSKRPTVYLPVNVLFDLAVFKKSPIFTDVLDMLDWTIKFFSCHPEYNLILKAHPAEKLFYDSHLQNADRYCLANWLSSRNYNLPDNIRFLDYDSPISSFDILPLIRLGLVYTSTTSIEMAWNGIPVVTTSYNHYNHKGFTFTPQSKDELSSTITDILSKTETSANKKSRILNSKKYYLLYYYHTFVNFGLIQGSDTGKVKDTILYESLNKLLPGANPALDYVCESILKKKEIIGPKRWPPFTEPQ